MKTLYILLLLGICLSFTGLPNIYAVNELSILPPTSYATYPGYIDEAVIVVEPHGGYFEQSLYLEYSDHGRWPGTRDIEIIHQFTLPEGSVVNDMWLWIGDSVMKAIVLDKWTASAIYDSIVTTKKDPCIVRKTGNQYEMKIYPLTSGQYRKVKLNIITPVKWIGNEATAELPLDLLKASDEPVSPLHILFRETEDIWGEPEITGLPVQFSYLTDSLGYRFRESEISDISQLTSLNVKYKTEFSAGKYITGYSTAEDSSYFQIGIEPGEFFGLEKDAGYTNKYFGLDLSGSFGIDANDFIPNLKESMKSALSEGDEFNLTVTGKKEDWLYTSDWTNYSEENINSALADFIGTGIIDSVNSATKTKVVFCDRDAVTGWYFNGLSEYADVNQFNDIVSAANAGFYNKDIVAAYRHGHDDQLSTGDFNQVVLPELEKLFEKGGRFLTYFDNNRIGVELIANHYVDGITSTYTGGNTVTLYANDEGNIGKYLPDEIDRLSVYYLHTDDPDVKVELATADGHAAVISKKVKNGLIVVSGIWQLRDDEAAKATLNPGLLGLFETETTGNPETLLKLIKTESVSHQIDKCFLFSNADSVYDFNDTENYLNQYLGAFASAPVFNTVNLLGTDNYAGSVNYDLKEYSGSGLLLSELAKRTGGIYSSLETSDWDYIRYTFSPDNYPVMKNLQMDWRIDNGAGYLRESREVAKVVNDPNKPLFFIGQINGNEQIDLNLTAEFAGYDNPVSRSVSYSFAADTGATEELIPTLLASEHLKEMIASPQYDTASVVDLAVKYNLLCDYTALLALEPNDELQFMKNPFDESGLVTYVEENEEAEEDSVEFGVYPNPFNNEANIRFSLNEPSIVNVAIYNILGEKVIDVVANREMKGVNRVSWNGKNNYGVTAASGLYILRAEIKGITTNKTQVYTHKLMYLK